MPVVPFSFQLQIIAKSTKCREGFFFFNNYDMAHMTHACNYIMAKRVKNERWNRFFFFDDKNLHAFMSCGHLSIVADRGQHESQYILTAGNDDDYDDD